MSTEENEKPSKKKSTKGAKTAKQKLAEGAPKIRKLEAAKKKKAGVKKVSSTTRKAKAKAIKVDEIIPKVVIPKDDIGDIMQRRVVMAEDGASLMLDSETTAGESVKIFDSLVTNVEMSGLLLGDFVNQATNLKAFGGKYAVIMASTGRSLDRLKTFSSVAKNTPPKLRNRHPAIKFEHLREIVKVPELEDKKTIIAEAVKAAESGRPMTVKEIRAKADEFKPRKKKAVKKSEANTQTTTGQQPASVLREPTAEERVVLEEIENMAAQLASACEAASFAGEISVSVTTTLREKLTRIADFLGSLAS